MLKLSRDKKAKHTPYWGWGRKALSYYVTPDLSHDCKREIYKRRAKILHGMGGKTKKN